MTNNTYNTSGTYSLDHTVDTAVANSAVQNLFETALGTAASSSGLTTYAGYMLNGTDTETQIASALTSLSRVPTKYGSMSNADFVSQVFANGLGRLPTAAEASYWTSELNSGAITKESWWLRWRRARIISKRKTSRSRRFRSQGRATSSTQPATR